MVMTAPEATAPQSERSGAAAPALFLLKTRPEFLKAARARRQSAPAFLLQARHRTADEPTPAAIRVGFTCSKKVGNAVARNRAKRRLRSLAREVLPRDGRPGWDYVLIGKAGATADRPWSQLVTDLEKALSRIHTAPEDTAPGDRGR